MALSGWTYRQSHIITSSSVLSDYQIQFTVYKASGISSGSIIYCNNHCNDDFSDIRFTDTSDNVYSYWIESYTSGVSAKIWVKFTSLSTSNTIYVYYGNSSATSLSSGDNTFLFFDDFTGSSLNTTKWTDTASSGTRSFSNSLMNVSITGSNTHNCITAISDINDATVITGTKIRVSTCSTTSCGARLNIKTSGITVGAVFAFHSPTTGEYQLLPGNESISWGTVLQSASLSTWYTLEIRHDYISTFYYRNGQSGGWSSYAINPAGTHLSLHTVAYNGGTTVADYDWVYQRKYSSSEPVHSTWDSEIINTSLPIEIFVSAPSGVLPFTPTFLISISNNLTNFNLIFGDNNSYSSSLQSSFSTTHTYSEFGTYNIYAEGYYNNILYTSYASVVAYSSSITSSFAYTKNGNIVYFTDTTTGSPNEWYWDFGDGNYSYSQNPIHHYVELGTYTVTLYSSNQQYYSQYSTTITISSIIYEHSPVANFKPSCLNVITSDLPVSVSFTDLSYPASGNTYLWDFGDGNVSELQSPTHSYVSLGYYDVSLTTTNSYGSDTITYIDCIKIHNESRTFKETLNYDDSFATFGIVVFLESPTYNDTFIRAKLFNEYATYSQSEYPSSPGIDEYNNLSFYGNINEYCEMVFTNVSDYVKRKIISPVMSNLGFKILQMKTFEENIKYDDSLEFNT